MPFLTPGSENQNRFFPDVGSCFSDLGSHILVLMSRFSNLYFQSFETIFWVKKVLRNLIRDPGWKNSDTG